MPMPEEHTEAKDEEDVETITQEEILQAIPKLKLGKSAESDNITAEMLKFMGEEELHERNSHRHENRGRME